MNIQVKKVFDRSLRIGLALSLTAGVLFSGSTFASSVPNAPSNVRITDVAGDGFNVAWNAASFSAQVTKYQVFNGGTLVDETNATSYFVIGLESAKTYPISVKACTAEDVCSAASAVVNARTLDIIKPTAPTKLTVSNITASGFRLNWTDATDNIAVAGYKVFLNNVEVINHAKSQYFATGLAADTTYGLKVVAYDQAGNESLASSVLNVRTLPGTPPPPDTIVPSAPRNLAASNVTMTSFRVNWSYATDNVGIKEYEVYRNGVLVGKTPHLAFLFTGIVPGSTNLIRVVSVDPSGNKSILSNVLTVVTLVGNSRTETIAPTTPTNVASTNITSSAFTVNWTVSTDNVYVLGYNVYVNGRYVTSVEGAANSYTVTGLTSNTNYNVRIQAYDVAKNRSALSTNVTVRTR